MPMYGYDDAVFMMSSASGATVAVNLSQYIFSLNGVKIEALLAETHAMGDAWREVAWVGVKQGDDVTVGGAYNDIASGPHFYWGQTSNPGTSRNYEISFGSSDIVAFTGVLKSYSRLPVRNELTMFEAVIGITGAITTAT